MSSWVCLRPRRLCIVVAARQGVVRATATYAVAPIPAEHTQIARMLDFKCLTARLFVSPAYLSGFLVSAPLRSASTEQFSRIPSCTCRGNMAASFGLKLVLFQVLLACVCGAVMLGLRVRSESWHQDPSKQPVRVLRQASDCAHLSSPISRADCEEQPHSREILSPPKMAASKRQAGAPSSAQQQQHSTDKKEQTSASNQPGTVTNPLATSSVPAEEVPSRHGHSQWLRAHKHGDLPMLSPDRSPDSDTWNNSVSICACMLQENTTDVREWLLYHRWDPACWLLLFGTAFLVNVTAAALYTL